MNCEPSKAKPELTRSQMLKLAERVWEGEQGLIEKAKEHFTLTSSEENYLYAIQQLKPILK